MDLWLNFGLAWVAVVLAFILSVIYVLRIAGKRLPRDNKLTRLNKILRKHHKLIGIILIAVGLVHGIFSSISVLSFNLGTISWIVTILLGVSWMIRKLLVKRKWWMYAHRVLTVLFIGLIVWHVVDVGGVQVFSLLFPQTTSYAQGSTQDSAAPVDITNIVTGNMGVSGTGGNSTGTASQSASPSASAGSQTPGKLLMGGHYKDGTYSGTATGFEPGLTVSVVIKSNTIQSVKVISSNETPKYLSRAAGRVTQAIVTSQSTNVDTVSGATYSSRGIMDAVDNALAKALIK